MAGDPRYHVKLRDEAGGRELGLLLTGTPLGYQKNLSNPYAAKAGTGQSKYSDLTEWSVWAQDDWRGGRGHETKRDEPNCFWEAEGVETRIQGQLTLGPLPHVPSGTYASHVPGSVSDYALGFPGPETSTWSLDILYIPVPDTSGIYTKWAQRFYVPDDGFPHKLESISLGLKKDAATSGNITVEIFLCDLGRPSAPTGSALASKTLTEADVGTSIAWVDFTFTSALDVSEGTWYWIVVTTTAAIAAPFEWTNVGDGGANYRGTGGHAMYWDGAYWQHDYVRDFRFKANWQKVAREQSYLGVAAHSLQKVYLYLRKTGTIGTYTVGLYADSGGDPTGSALKSDTFTDADVSTTASWIELDFGSAHTQSAATYHLVVDPPSSADEEGAFVIWGGDSAAGYASGAGQIEYGASGTWAAASADYYFQIDTNDMAGAPIAFARLGSGWYVMAGDTVYAWNESNDNWDSKVDENTTGTDLETWAGKLWAAWGNGVNLHYSADGASWTDASVKANLLRGGGGYLHRTDGTTHSENDVYYTTSATAATWSSVMECGMSGDNAYDVNALEWFGDHLLAATPTRLYVIQEVLGPYPILTWRSMEYTNNGLNMLTWSRDNALYIPLQYGLYRYNGDSMLPVGPEGVQVTPGYEAFWASGGGTVYPSAGGSKYGPGGIGLPYNRSGFVADIVGTNNWLFVAVDGGTTGISSILAYNGMGGWHELYRGEAAGTRIRALGYETIHSPPRLWFGYGNEAYYIQLPDYSDNPYGWTGYEFNSSGEIITSWFGEELGEVIKDLHAIIIKGEDFSSSVTVDVWYEIDHSDRWTHAGQITEAPRQTLELESSGFAKKTLTSGSTTTTIELASGSDTTDMVAGDWCLINGEIVQVSSITDSNTFVLERGLNTAPLLDDVVYPSRPAGSEFRLKLVLASASTSSTPKVEAIFLRYQNNVLDRYVHTLSVRVEDGMEDLAGNAYPYSADALRNEIEDFAKKNTPFVLEDPDGNEYTVKCTSAAEGGYITRKTAGGVPHYDSVYSMNLVEVE